MATKPQVQCTKMDHLILVSLVRFPKIKLTLDMGTGLVSSNVCSNTAQYKHMLAQARKYATEAAA